MREITTHKLTGLNEAIRITVEDKPDPGGANHQYLLIVTKTYPPTDAQERAGLMLNFQNGPIGEVGVNGISNEALLAVLIDRMQGFQFQRCDDGEFRFGVPGPFACRENAIALTKLEEAMMWLQKRTRDRMARGVEGTMNK